MQSQQDSKQIEELKTKRNIWANVLVNGLGYDFYEIQNLFLEDLVRFLKYEPKSKDDSNLNWTVLSERSYDRGMILISLLRSLCYNTSKNRRAKFLPDIMLSKTSKLGIEYVKPIIHELLRWTCEFGRIKEKLKNSEGTWERFSFSFKIGYEKRKTIIFCILIPNLIPGIPLIKEVKEPISNNCPNYC